ncbi:MAG: sigma-70 family RNA polymerase sigma factor [Verrucomicrobia bacterium]|nr:sigma-70 family RNA polymerase sigma factor [Verrucomicrobiota bacterium]
MSIESADCELVGAYAREGSEAAFRALVARHVNLVFGAALRQTGDAGVSEEVTQNVFVALARKAPRLASHETLAGWLHRTAILESKARLRAELRRQRREHVAAALDEQRREGRSPVEDLVPLLDEGMLRLKESDREALILRFLEERSLREVGEALGIAEDSARKRVDRALERLGDWFRSQGFAIPTGAATVLVQASAASAAPAGLAMAAASAGLGAAGHGGLAALLGLSVLQVANLQTAGLCALLVAMPLGWRWTQHRHLEASAQGRSRKGQDNYWIGGESGQQGTIQL